MEPLVKHAVRSGLVALVAVATVTGSAVLGPAQAAPERSRDAARARAAAVLDRVQEVFSGEARGARSARSGPQKVDVTLLLNDLRRALPDLGAADRGRAGRFLARPTEGEGDPKVCAQCHPTKLDGTVATQSTAHFSIHYQASPPLLGRDQRPPAGYVDQVAAVLEHVYTAEITNLHYKAPLSDVATSSPGDKGNPDGLIDVFLADTGVDGLYGYANADSGIGNRAAPYLVLDNDFAPAQFGGAPATSSLQVTVAHEFFHGVQFGYDASEQSWFLEGSAVWMEDVVYPAVNDYLQYLPVSNVKQPRTPTNFNGGLNVYGAVTFFKFLSERFRDNDIVRRVWNAADASGPRSGVQAVGAVLAARGYSFAPEFARYALWNTLPPKTYGDRALWLKRVSPGAWLSTAVSKGRRDTGVRKVRLNHLSSAPLVVRAGAGMPKRTKLRVWVDGPNSSHGTRATLQLRMRSGAVRLNTVGLNKKGNAVRTFAFNPRYVRSAVLIVSNASVGYDNQPFQVRARALF